MQARSGTARFQDRADNSTVKIYGRYKTTIIGGSKERASAKPVSTITSVQCRASANAAVTAASDLPASRNSRWFASVECLRPRILPRQ